MTQDHDYDDSWELTDPGDQHSSGARGLECGWDLSWPWRVTAPCRSEVMAGGVI